MLTASPLLDFLQITGTFTWKNNLPQVKVSDSSDTESVLDLLLPFVGSACKVVLCHRPLSGVDPSVPGLGTCRYVYQECPIHGKHPKDLFFSSAEGILSRDIRHLTDPKSGEKFPLYWESMAGHEGQILVLKSDESLYTKHHLGSKEVV